MEAPYRASYGQPLARRSEEALRVVEHHRNPRAAWEALCAAGLLPESWLFAPSRSFCLPRTAYRRYRALDALGEEALSRRDVGRMKGLRASAVPGDPRWAAQLAGDLDGALAAEELARESVRRAWRMAVRFADPVPEGWSGPPEVLWIARTRRRGEARWGFPPLVLGEAFEWIAGLSRLMRSPSRGGSVFGQLLKERLLPSLRARLGGDGEAAVPELNPSFDASPASWLEVWLPRASALVLALRELTPASSLSEYSPGRSGDARTSALEDPFGPWLEVLKLGYVLREADSRAVLLATPPP